MRPLSVAEIIESTSAKPVGIALVEGLPPVSGVCTDSRQVQPGDLFVALRGERTDGHQYLQEVFERGAVSALVEYVPIGAEGMPLLKVASTVRALGELARYYRRKMGTRVIGITGSTGKTSTKEMIATALESQLLGKVARSAGNYNTEIGVPLTLLGLEPHHELLVQEMAMRGLGQIAYLAEIAEPQVGVITQIGWAHLEMVGSREGIAQAKSELVDALPEDGIAILPHDDKYYEFLRSRCRCRRIYTFGKHPETHARLVEARFAPETTEGTVVLQVEPDREPVSVSVRLPYLGEHMLMNATCALLVATVMGCDPVRAARALENVQLPEMRMAIQPQRGGWTLINDAYNANPDSMRSALEVLVRQVPARRRIAVLGDMKELGNYSMRLHWQLGRWLATLPLDYVLLVGTEVLWTAAAAKEGGFPAQRLLHCETPSHAGEWLLNHVQQGDWVLLKGSRAVGLEQILKLCV
ncbi:MAG: UDP-N-acetylmuramoyl-tripeptide--D-alanyl-D-alanine ligase [Fimbriimonadales bacterium]